MHVFVICFRRYDIVYSQDVSSEDMFLGMNNKTPATASCENMTVSHDSLLFLVRKFDQNTHWVAVIKTIARFRDRSLITTFCLLHRKLVDAVDWQVAKKIGSLSFYTKMSRRWLISSLKLKGLYHWDFLIINTELKRKDENFMYSRSLEDRNPEFLVS